MGDIFQHPSLALVTTASKYSMGISVHRMGRKPKGKKNVRMYATAKDVETWVGRQEGETSRHQGPGAGL